MPFVRLYHEFTQSDGPKRAVTTNTQREQDEVQAWRCTTPDVHCPVHAQ